MTLAIFIDTSAWARPTLQVRRLRYFCQYLLECKIAVADEVVNLFFDDIQTGAGEYIAPLFGGTDLLVAELVEEVMFKTGGAMLAEPLGVLKAEFADNQDSVRESSFQIF